MASPTTSSSTLPSLAPDQDISPTAYITLFTLGSLVLILLVAVACYSIFRTRRTFDRQFGLSNEKQGLGEEIVASYPKMMFSQVKIKYGNSSSSCSSDQNLGLCCSICLADFKEVDMVLLLPNCGHFFHVKCVDPWLRLHATCPLCRNSPILIPPDTRLEMQEERNES